MSEDVETPPQATTPPNAAGPAPEYVSPLIERLGTLAELTQGGTVGPGDSINGNSGDEGTL